ncbi:MAG: FAD:protein FMN transferase [Balneolaceae bacterium]|nr:MAG: FAD:protein FMN transferase [Balneolaceae bacterium]
MGTQFSVILYAENELLAKEASDAAFERIEELNGIMSDYIEESELNRLSRTSGSGQAVKVSDELFEVLRTAWVISEKTDGVFDVTIGPMTRAWRVKRMMPEPQLPDDNELEELLSRVGYQHMVMDEEAKSVLLQKENMRLDLGGIAKGYAAEEAVRVIQTYGIRSVLVDAGGDITLGDPPPGRESWDVAVPKVRRDPSAEHIRLRLAGKTVTTSGDMFQYIEIGGKRYSHIINPKTGIGSTDRLQATVVSSNGMYADAFASALTLMDPEDGIALINRLEETEAVIFQNTEEGIIEWMSDGIARFVY